MTSFAKSQVQTQKLPQFASYPQDHNQVLCNSIQFALRGMFAQAPLKFLAGAPEAAELGLS